jgi:CRISPR-associated exonuclease Cas4
MCNLKLETSNLEAFPLSLLNDFLYCPRRAALKAVEGMRSENQFTLAGDIVHEQVDFPGFEERAGWTLLRALPLMSDALGLIGKADLVEVQFEGSVPARHDNAGPDLKSHISNLRPSISDLRSQSIRAARPVEYKAGKQSKWINDKVQLCAQALCLEEMFGIAVAEGMIFHAKSQKRATVVFDEVLRRETVQAIAGLRQGIEEASIPAAVLKPQCEGCSLHELCLPELAGANVIQAHRRLFEV